MGGSHLAADIIKAWHPEIDIIVWSNYGLPPLAEKDLKDRLIILSSYSGSTEETLDAFAVAKAKKLSIRRRCRKRKIDLARRQGKDPVRAHAGSSSPAAHGDRA